MLRYSILLALGACGHAEPGSDPDATPEPPTPLDAIRIVDADELATFDELEEIELAIGAYSRWTGETVADVDEIHLLPHVFSHTGIEVAGKYDHSRRVIEVSMQPAVFGRLWTVVHELCHDLDHRYAYSSSHPDIFDESLIEEVEVYDTADGRRREAFARACGAPPHGVQLFAARDEDCENPVLDPRDRFLAEEVWIDPVDYSAARPVVDVAWIDVAIDPIDGARHLSRAVGHRGRLLVIQNAVVWLEDEERPAFRPELLAVDPSTGEVERTQLLPPWEDVYPYDLSVDVLGTDADPLLVWTREDDNAHTRAGEWLRGDELVPVELPQHEGYWYDGRAVGDTLLYTNVVDRDATVAAWDLIAAAPVELPPRLRGAEWPHRYSESGDGVAFLADLHLATWDGAVGGEVRAGWLSSYVTDLGVVGSDAEGWLSGAVRRDDDGQQRAVLVEVDPDSGEVAIPEDPCDHRDADLVRTGGVDWQVAWDADAGVLSVGRVQR